MKCFHGPQVVNISCHEEERTIEWKKGVDTAT